MVSTVTTFKAGQQSLIQLAYLDYGICQYYNENKKGIKYDFEKKIESDY